LYSRSVVNKPLLSSLLFVQDPFTFLHFIIAGWAVLFGLCIFLYERGPGQQRSGVGSAVALVT
jgi:hypothetical protein